MEVTEATQRKELLSQVFSSLDSDAIHELEEIALRVHYDEDELIAQEGSYASGVYVVESGLISIGKYGSTPGERRVLRLLGVGDLFGLQAVILERNLLNVQFAKALIPSTLIFVERRNLLAFRNRHPELLADFCRWLAREVILLEFKLTRDALESLDRNLALLLIALTSKYGERRGGTEQGVVLDLPITRQTMAEMLGVSIETLMRSLKRFRERELLRTSGRKIVITNLPGLEDRAKTPPFYLAIVEETL